MNSVVVKPEVRMRIVDGKCTLILPADRAQVRAGGTLEVALSDDELLRLDERLSYAIGRGYDGRTIAYGG